MLKASTIVCRFDDSSASLETLPLAAKLAGDMGARLVLVDVIQNHNWSIYAAAIFNPERERARAIERVEPLVREIMRRSPEVAWELKVEAGHDLKVIKSVVEATGADLLVSVRHRGRLEILESFRREGLAAADDAHMAAPDFILSRAAIVGETHQAAAF